MQPVDPTIPPIHFAPARGARLAYQVWGEGPPTIVAIPPLAQNIEVAWQWPDIRAMFERFGSIGRYLHFDKRGTGCSDRRSQVNAIDERVDDLRAVMDHAGIDRAHLFGLSEGGPMTLLFAATYPNRVDSVILSGSGASMYPPMDEAKREELRDRAYRIAELWGTPESPLVDNFAPSLAANQEFRSWHQSYERVAATTDSLVELIHLTIDIDITEILPRIDVPVLLLHRTGDRAVSVQRSREAAALLPNAVLIEQPGDDHYIYAGDRDGWLDELERWVTGTVQPRPASTTADHSVRITTFGRFAVEVDGEEVPKSAWGSRLARQLCKRLVAARGWPVTRDELMDLLWPEEFDPAKLGARLSVQLSAVRKVLGGGVIADRESVRLDLDEVSTDLEDLHRATDDAAIVAAYTGEFLPEDVYDDWTGATRNEARSRFVAAARRLADRHVAGDLPNKAVPLARRLIEIDGYDDDAHRLLISALAATGEKGEARRAHEAWAALLHELDVPVPAFDSLVEPD